MHARTARSFVVGAVVCLVPLAVSVGRAENERQTTVTRSNGVAPTQSVRGTGRHRAAGMQQHSIELGRDVAGSELEGTPSPSPTSALLPTTPLLDQHGDARLLPRNAIVLLSTGPIATDPAGALARSLLVQIEDRDLNTEVVSILLNATDWTRTAAWARHHAALHEVLTGATFAHDPAILIVRQDAIEATLPPDATATEVLHHL